MTQSKSEGLDQEDARLLPRLSTTTSTAPVTVAGRELDALVAEKVMGAKWVRDFGRQTGRGYYRLYLDHLVLAERYDGHDPVYAESPVLRRYSTSIADAWLVVEKLREDGWVIGIGIDDEPWEDPAGGGTHGCSLLGCNRGRTDATDIREYADTTPLAICLAALKAVGA